MVTRSPVLIQQKKEEKHTTKKAGSEIEFPVHLHVVFVVAEWYSTYSLLTYLRGAKCVMYVRMYVYA